MDESLIQSLVAYMVWADHAILDSLSKLDREILQRDLKISHGGILTTVHHMYRAECVWIERITGRGDAQITEYAAPDDLTALALDWAGCHAKWQSLAGGQQNWNRNITHTNQSGKSFTLPLWQIVLHVVNHSTLHRGQVMGMIRQAGIAPPNTDLITYYRTYAAAAA